MVTSKNYQSYTISHGRIRLRAQMSSTQLSVHRVIFTYTIYTRFIINNKTEENSLYVNNVNTGKKYWKFYEDQTPESSDCVCYRLRLSAADIIVIVNILILRIR